MRKEMDLEMEERVNVSIGVKDEESQKYLEDQEDYIKREVRTRRLEIGSPEEVTEQRYKKEWTINDQPFVMSLKRVE